MPKKKDKVMSTRVSDDAVKGKTGKNWQEWFEVLDEEGAKKMSHKEIVAIVNKKYHVGSWWQKMVVVSYEQARGLRKVYEKTDGYSISVSRTMGVSVSALYKAWVNDKARKRWLSEDIVIRKATENKSIHITWSDEKTSVEVNFYSKGDSKAQVVVQHSKLSDAKSADLKKIYWAKTLDKLQEIKI